MNNSLDVKVKTQFIKRQACFAKFTETESKELASILTEVRFKKGETIVTEGDPVDSVFLIVEGKADVQIQEKKDDEPYMKSIAELGTGDAIGLNDTGFYSLSGKRTATVIAKTDVLLLHLKITEFHGFSLAHHHVNEIMRQNAIEILGLNSDMSE